MRLAKARAAPDVVVIAAVNLIGLMWFCPRRCESDAVTVELISPEVTKTVQIRKYW